MNFWRCGLLWVGSTCRVHGLSSLCFSADVDSQSEHDESRPTIGTHLVAGLRAGMSAASADLARNGTPAAVQHAIVPARSGPTTGNGFDVAGVWLVHVVAAFDDLNRTGFPDVVDQAFVGSRSPIVLTLLVFSCVSTASRAQRSCMGRASDDFVAFFRG